MEIYIKWLVDDFRANSKALGDLLYEIDTPDAKSRYADEYLKAYEAAMQMMIQSSIGSTPDQPSGGAGGRAPG